MIKFVQNTVCPPRFNIFYCKTNFSNLSIYKFVSFTCQSSFEEVMNQTFYRIWTLMLVFTKFALNIIWKFIKHLILILHGILHGNLVVRLPCMIYRIEISYNTNWLKTIMSLNKAFSFSLNVGLFNKDESSASSTNYQRFDNS